VAAGDKPDKPRTTSEDAIAGGPPTEQNEVPFGTMQMPHGGFPPSIPPAMPEAAPLLPTQMPGAAVVPNVQPPTIPAEARYSHDKEIARGGMGRVIEATDSVLGRTVALKEVLSLDTETVRRFQRETRITARLEHPAIVPVHDAGIGPSGAPFYVMRKIGGRALEDLVAKADTVEKRLALVPHIVAASNAVAHAHERGIVHRDIKPANILCGDLGETIVIDWGLAKAIGEAEDAQDPKARVLDDSEDDPSIKTRAGIVFGTPGFMAPEQLRGRPVDERCDVYALGATLYHLLARRPPHHHKNADVMMRAAVDGPPIPILEHVPTLPPELAAIVEKALAHDATKRYQTARELAEDLQKFLTGKLVGAHQYTAREKLVRWVKQNRAAVTVAGVALVTLVAGVAFYIVRVSNERDRADAAARIAITERRKADAQRDEVVKKARELTLTNARHASSTDPTRALAMVKPLVEPVDRLRTPCGEPGTCDGDPLLWRSARDVGAAARAHGVAFSIPLSKHTLTLELSRDGNRALAAGDDGKVRLVDIEKRTTKEVANVGGAVMARFADGERMIVLYQGSVITIVDVATNGKREVTAPTAISRLEVSGPLAYWVDPANTVWRLDLAGGPPTKVEVAEPVTLVSPSPDGRWIAFGGTQHLLLADRSNPTLPPEIKIEGEVHMLAWSSDSKHLAVHISDEVVDMKMEPVPQVWHRYLAGQRYGIAFSGTRMFSSGPRGVAMMPIRDDKLRVTSEGHTLGLYEGREKVVISAKPSGELVVLSDYGDHVLRAPQPIERVAASARGPWIVAAADGMLLVWNIEQFEPRSYANVPPSSARFVTGDSMIVTYQNESAEWLDLRTGKATELGGELPGIASVVAAPDGAEAIAIDITQRGWRVAGIGQPQSLGDVRAAAYVDNSRLVLATPTGLVLEDLQKKSKGTLLAHEAAISDLVATWTEGGWIAASFSDGLVFRKSLKAPEGKLQLAAPLPEQLPLAIAADGTVLLGVGTELRAWKVDGTTESIAKLDKRIVRVVLAEPRVAIVHGDDGSLHVIDVAAKKVTTSLQVSPLASVAADGSLAAGPTMTGGVEVIDPLVNWRWPLATPQKDFQPPFLYVEVARDGSRVLGLTQNAVVVWTLDLPRTADDTGVWLDKTTNATADSPNGPLGWR